MKINSLFSRSPLSVQDVILSVPSQGMYAYIYYTHNFLFYTIGFFYYDFSYQSVIFFQVTSYGYTSFFLMIACSIYSVGKMSKLFNYSLPIGGILGFNKIFFKTITDGYSEHPCLFLWTQETFLQDRFIEVELLCLRVYGHILRFLYMLAISFLET